MCVPVAKTECCTNGQTDACVPTYTYDPDQEECTEDLNDGNAASTTTKDKCCTAGIAATDDTLKMACAAPDTDIVIAYDPDLKICSRTTTTTFHDGQDQTVALENLASTECCTEGEAKDDMDLKKACCQDKTNEETYVWNAENRSCVSQTLVKEGTDIFSTHVKSWHHQKCCDIGNEMSDESLKGACISDPS